MIISTTARRNTESGGKCLAMKQIRHKTWTRIGLIRYEGGSVLFHVEIVHWIRRSILPIIFTRRSSVPARERTSGQQAIGNLQPIELRFDCCWPQVHHCELGGQRLVGLVTCLRRLGERGRGPSQLWRPSTGPRLCWCIWGNQHRLPCRPFIVQCWNDSRNDLLWWSPDLIATVLGKEILKLRVKLKPWKVKVVRSCISKLSSSCLHHFWWDWYI